MKGVMRIRSEYPTSIGRRRRIRPNDAGHIGCGSDCVRHFNPEIDKRNEIRIKGATQNEVDDSIHRFFSEEVLSVRPSDRSFYGRVYTSVSGKGREVFYRRSHGTGKPLPMPATRSLRMASPLACLRINIEAAWRKVDNLIKAEIRRAFPLFIFNHTPNNAFIIIK